MRLPIRAALIAASALSTPALAASEAPGDYLPGNIVVSGVRDGYSSADGSTATKTPTPLIDVPQTVTVITEDQLRDQAITRMGDALRYVPGVTLDTGEGHRDAVYIRGQASTADFYLDGLRDDAQYYRSLYNVSRVEVLKGANALIFGRGGGGGVINRVSKVADPARAALALDAGIDSFGAYALTADVNQPLSDAVAARIATTYETFDNARDYFHGHFFGVSPTVSARLGDRTTVSAFYTHDSDRRVTDRGIPSLNGEPLKGYDRTFFGDPDFNRARTDADIARVRIDHGFSDSLSVNLTGEYADYDLFYANAVPSSTDGSTVTLGGYTSGTTRQNRIVQGNLVWQGATGPLHHTLLAGFEAGRQDTGATRTDVDFGGGAASVTVALARRLAVPSTTVGALTRASTSQLDFVSGYVQDQIELGPVQLIGGIRYDDFALDSVNLVNGLALSRSDRKWSPRAGVVFKPMEALSFYASYATSFLPQSGDQFSVLDATTASLEPEKFENREIGAKWAVTPRLFATAALFRLDRSNTRAADPANPGLTVLTGASRVSGFEASLVGHLASRWQASLGYTYLDGTIRSTTTAAPAGRRLQQVPRHQASAWTRYDFSRSFGLGFGAVYQSKQFASISNAVVLPAWVRFDAAAYLDLTERIGVQLNVENLFGRHYYPSGHGDNNIQPGDPRSIRLGVKFKL